MPLDRPDAKRQVGRMIFLPVDTAQHAGQTPQTVFQKLNTGVSSAELEQRENQGVFVKIGPATRIESTPSTRNDGTRELRTTCQGTFPVSRNPP